MSSSKAELLPHNPESTDIKLLEREIKYFQEDIINNFLSIEDLEEDLERIKQRSSKIKEQSSSLNESKDKTEVPTAGSTDITFLDTLLSERRTVDATREQIKTCSLELNKLIKEFEIKMENKDTVPHLERAFRDIQGLLDSTKNILSQINLEKYHLKEFAQALFSKAFQNEEKLINKSELLLDKYRENAIISALVTGEESVKVSGMSVEQDLNSCVGAPLNPEVQEAIKLHQNRQELLLTRYLQKHPKYQYNSQVQLEIGHNSYLFFSTPNENGTERVVRGSKLRGMYTEWNCRDSDVKLAVDHPEYIATISVESTKPN